MTRIVLSLCLALLAASPAAADYVDPWGLPSGTATLKLIPHGTAGTDELVQGFDFATGEVDSLLDYEALVLAGQADLLFVELGAGEATHWLRAPEGADFFDRELIHALEDSVDIGGITGFYDEDGDMVALERFAPVEPGFAYLLVQEQPDRIFQSACKLEVTAVGDSTVTFDWVWQPNGSFEFIPSATERSSMSRIKLRY